MSGYHIYQSAKQTGRIQIDFTAVPMGEDVAVIISGGDTPHLGAAAISQAYPNLEDAERISAAVSVIAFAGHKEDQLARHAASVITTRTRKNAAVSCGIHVNHIQPHEFKEIQQMVDDLLDEYTTLI